MLTSLEDQPVARASHLLLVAGGAVHNTGQQWNAAGSDLKSQGGAPTTIEQVRGTVTLKALATAISVSVQPLDGAGQPTGQPLRAVAAGAGDWNFPVGETPTTWYLISVKR